jgi:hypothetical protein
MQKGIIFSLCIVTYMTHAMPRNFEIKIIDSNDTHTYIYAYNIMLYTNNDVRRPITVICDSCK